MTRRVAESDICVMRYEVYDDGYGLHVRHLGWLASIMLSEIAHLERDRYLYEMLF